MTIQFNEISPRQRKPGMPLELNLKAGANSLPDNIQKVLIVAQKTSAGTAPDGVPVQLYSDADANSYFGAGSIAAIMCKRAIAANRYIQLYVLPLVDAANSAAAAGTIAVTGPAGAAGRITLYVGSTAVKINVAKGATANDIAALLLDAISSLADLPVTGTAAANIITLTAKNKGTLGNTIHLSAKTTATGVSFTVTAMAGGATDPELDTALATIVGERYHLIASSFNDADNLAALATHQELMCSAQKEKWGMGVFAYGTGALAGVCTLGASLNKWLLSGPYLRGSKSMPCEMAAVYASLFAAEEDPAKPLNTLVMTGIAAPAVADRLSSEEQESCLYNGVAPLEVNSNGEVEIVRAITTYVKDGAGNADATLLDVTTPRSMFYVAEAVLARLRAKFPRAKNTRKTRSSVKTEVMAVLKNLEDAEICENVSDNPPVVELDSSDPSRANVEIPADVVNGLHIIAGSIRLVA